MTRILMNVPRARATMGEHARTGSMASTACVQSVTMTTSASRTRTSATVTHVWTEQCVKMVSTGMVHLWSCVIEIQSLIGTILIIVYTNCWSRFTFCGASEGITLYVLRPLVCDALLLLVTCAPQNTGVSHTVGKGNEFACGNTFLFFA